MHSPVSSTPDSSIDSTESSPRTPTFPDDANVGSGQQPRSTARPAIIWSPLPIPPVFEPYVRPSAPLKRPGSPGEIEKSEALGAAKRLCTTSTASQEANSSCSNLPIPKPAIGVESVNSLPGPSRLDQHLVLDNTLDNFLKQALGLYKGCSVTAQQAAALYDEFKRPKAILAKEISCPRRSMHQDRKPCSCSANTEQSMTSQWKKQFPNGVPLLTANALDAATTIGIRNPTTWTDPKSQILQISAQKTPSVTLQTTRNQNSCPFKSENITLCNKQEELLKKAIREVVLPVDELAAIVGKRYENLVDGRQLPPMQPHTIETVLKGYGYGRQAD